MSESFLSGLIFIITAAFIGGFIARTLKLPSVLGYIVSGVVFGIIGKQYFHSYDSLVSLSQIGVSLLLFTLGFEVSFESLKKIGKRIFLASILQLFFTAVVLFPIMLFFHIQIAESILFSLLFSFSSTAVITKILEEQGILNEFPSTHIFTYLLLQDLYVVPFIFLLPLFASGHVFSVSQIILLCLSILKPALAIGLLLLVGRYFLATLLRVLYQYPSHELTILATLFLATLSIGILQSIGVPQSIAAFIAGVLISEQGENLAPLSEIRPLRDIFLVLFFVVTGMLLNISFFVSHLPLILVLPLAVVIVKFVVFDLILLSLLYKQSDSIQISSYMANIGELVIVVAQIAFLSHYISQDAYSISLSVFIVSLFCVPGFIQFSYLYSEKIGSVPFLAKLWKGNYEGESTPSHRLSEHVIICGHGRVGSSVRTLLEFAKIPYVVIDFNKKEIAALHEKNIHAIFGDPADEAVLESAGISHAKILVLASTTEQNRSDVIKNAKKINPNIIILCRSHSESDDHEDLLDLGVNFIAVPEFEAGIELSRHIFDRFHIRKMYSSTYIRKLKKTHHITST